MDKKVINFQREKETKNTVKFEEVVPENTAPQVGTLYVQKWVAGDVEKLKVTLEEVK